MAHEAAEFDATLAAAAGEDLALLNELRAARGGSLPQLTRPALGGRHEHID